MIQRLIDLLQEAKSVSELKRELCIRRKRDLEEMLRKVKEICRRKGWKFKVAPATCKKCGYKFQEDLKIPTQCPKCKSHWIDEPRFWIEK
jgi:predicted Zn-ribbon and HTH transcriptional regulator